MGCCLLSQPMTDAPRADGEKHECFLNSTMQSHCEHFWEVACHPHVHLAWITFCNCHLLANFHPTQSVSHAFSSFQLAASREIDGPVPH